MQIYILFIKKQFLQIKNKIDLSIQANLAYVIFLSRL